MTDIACSIEGCLAPRTCRGWCDQHYKRWRRHGDPEHTDIGPWRERLLAKIGAPTSTGCTEYLGAERNEGGYRQIRIDARREMAHRAMWVLHHGSVPAGMVVMHTCDNPPCVNIDHLTLGTVADNNADRAAKHRSAPVQGTHNGNAKLTDDDVREIRSRRADGETVASVAARFGIAHSLVSRIARQKAWAHV